jgi:hypothetical protein
VAQPLSLPDQCAGMRVDEVAVAADAELTGGADVDPVERPLARRARADP